MKNAKLISLMRLNIIKFRNETTIKNYLYYKNKALLIYKNQKKLFCFELNLFNFTIDIFFNYGASCWLFYKNCCKTGNSFYQFLFKLKSRNLYFEI